MSFLALFTNLTFYHLSLLTFIIGAQVYQSFFANIIASKTLNKNAFRILQNALWPMYFRLQMIVSLLLALTYPGGDAGVKAPFLGLPSVQGLFEGADRWTVSLPLATMVITSTANALVFVPLTIKWMWKRYAETKRDEKARGITSSETEDDKNSFVTDRDRKILQEDNPNSPELVALTRKFLTYHFISYGCNLVTVAASVGYAICLAERSL